MDKSGNTYDVGYYTVYVTNKTALAVSLKSSLKATYSWGETIVIPEAAVVDGAETLIYVTGPKTGYKIVRQGIRTSSNLTGNIIFTTSFTILSGISVASILWWR